ncbi:MAG: DNA double-strand break repair nuclease NurA [Anaerolineae bacterium]
MTLELNQIAPQLEAMEQHRAGQMDRHQQTLQAARACLHQFATDSEALQAKVNTAREIAEAQRFGWLGASPTAEPLDARHPLPDCPERLTVIGSDGSQIHPDRHSAVLYALINTGWIVYRHGSSQPPEAGTKSTLFYERKDLFDEQGHIWPPSVLNARRDLGETEALLQLARNYVEDGVPVVALNDGQLPLWSLDLPYNQQKLLRRKHAKLLAGLQELGAIVAGYVDRPRSTHLVNLLHLATLEQIDKDTLRDNPFLTLIDREVFDFLGPGERSALFVIESQANEYYQARGHSVHFFYLNVGQAGRGKLARVEVPVWVATDPDRLNILHAALIRQAWLTRREFPYPYALTRAHELAVITTAERQALERLIVRQTPGATGSSKALQKTWLGKRERFRT